MRKNPFARLLQTSTASLLLFASSKAGAATIQVALALPLAATSFNTSMSSALGIINAITAVLAFGGLTAATKRAVIEELSAFLEIPNGDKVVRNFYERMRKYNCACISVIQQYSRFRDSPVKSSVMGNCKQVFFLRQADKKDLDNICETFPLPEVTKRTIMRFPDMSKSRGGPESYSGYVLYQLGAAKPVITTCRNYIDKETAYVTSSTGSVFEQREKDMRGATSIVDAVIKFANPDQAELLTNHAA